ncbi:alpha/beta fold hydrolase [Pseudonocardia bannensis]|uniref:Alpha/beta fold hydrolase n=1 Tax=Pseudonocardia bannensis TaxID=630973 RepID=A0A848DIP9_9PSEU|nr:alpha/beta fold hydrolase [Pseudonocardia bannensis]NMH92568.1 alpha/beta fold hydrolase [Pseudonocardia bannensis]
MDGVDPATGADREHAITLPGRGRTVVWDSPGPPGAPTLILLHGVALNAELNWSGVIPALRRHYRVLTLDLPGHGRGIAGSAPFRLEDCADDIAALATDLGVARLIPVGYSMGGLVAQLLWHRHPGLTAGLVLCSTARDVSGSAWERSTALMLPGIVAVAAWIPVLHVLGADVVGAQLLDGGTDPITRRWALAQMRRTRLLEALTAAQAACRFTSHEWIGSVDVPTAVVITRCDRVVSPDRQRILADAVPGRVVHEIDGGHGVFLTAPDRFASVLLRACASVSHADRPPADAAARSAS